jgi:hypothetical protein
MNRISDSLPGTPDQRFRLVSGKPTSVPLNGSSPEGHCYGSSGVNQAIDLTPSIELSLSRKDAIALIE